MTPVTQSERQHYGWFILSVILAMCGLQWFASGEIIIPYKGIALVGDEARVVSAFWILIFFLSGIYPYLKSLLAESRLGACLTSAGLLVGGALTVIITLKYSLLAGLLSGVITAVIMMIPGIMICGIADEIKINNQDAEQAPPAGRDEAPRS